MDLDHISALTYNWRGCFPPAQVRSHGAQCISECYVGPAPSMGLSEMQQMENESIPTDTSGVCTYLTVYFYLVNFLRLYENRSWYKPNAINNLDDYVY